MNFRMLGNVIEKKNIKRITRSSIQNGRRITQILYRDSRFPDTEEI